jgi:hypothetical protein
MFPFSGRIHAVLHWLLVTQTNWWIRCGTNDAASQFRTDYHSAKIIAIQTIHKTRIHDYITPNLGQRKLCFRNICFAYNQLTRRLGGQVKWEHRILIHLKRGWNWFFSVVMAKFNFIPFSIPSPPTVPQKWTINSNYSVVQKQSDASL